jgi:tetratricopeptide (TPR) repeat protein
MALRLNDEFVPDPEESDAELQKLKHLLETGDPAEQQAALEDLVTRGAESTLTACLTSKNPRVAHLATNGLWECWLNEKGPAARHEMDKGIARMSAGKLEGALEIFATLAQQYPQWAEAINKQATVLYLLGNARLSYKLCKFVVELKPHHFGAWNGMALCAAQMEKWQEALDAATTALNIQPAAEGNVDLIELAKSKLSEKS